jgi:hypothetical protein
LFPFKITGFRLVPPRARVKGAQDPVAKAGASFLNRLISRLTRSIFKR